MYIKQPVTAAIGAHARPGSGNRRVAIGFEDDLFDQINKIVVRDQISFGEAVRRLCRSGLWLSNTERK